MYKRSDTPVEPDSTLTQNSVVCVNPVHPEFLDRPGCLEGLEIGAKLRNRYKKLNHGCNRRDDEITVLLKNVTHYERQCVLFSDWLQEIEGKLQNQKPLVISCDKLRNELQMANVSEVYLVKLDLLGSTCSQIVIVTHARPVLCLYSLQYLLTFRIFF